MEIDGYWIWIFEMMAEENKRVKSKLYQEKPTKSSKNDGRLNGRA
jgi:hypothetical protein